MILNLNDLFARPLKRKHLARCLQLAFTWPFFYFIIIFSRRYQLDSFDAQANINFINFLCDSSSTLASDYVPRSSEPIFWLFSKYIGCPSTHIEFFRMVALVISFLFSVFLALVKRLNLSLLILGAVTIALPSYNYYHLYRQSLFLFFLLTFVGILTCVPPRFRRTTKVFSLIFLALMHNSSFAVISLFALAFRAREYMSSLASSGILRIPKRISQRTILILLCLLIASSLAIPLFVQFIAQPQLIASFLGLFTLNSMSRTVLFQLIIQLFLLSALSLLTFSRSLSSILSYNLYFILFLCFADLAIGTQQAFRIFWPFSSIGYYLFCVFGFNYSASVKIPVTLLLAKKIHY